MGGTRPDGRVRMPAPLIYVPTPVASPRSAERTRRFEDPRQHLPGRPPLEACDYASYDRHAIFHDVYLAADGRAMEALGPPLVDLADDLLPVEARLDGEDGPLLHRCHRWDRVTLHRFVPRARAGRREPISGRRLSLRFADGTCDELAIARPSLAPVEVQFTTLQKDNPVEWIEDWLRYLADIGVERVLFYDNASTNRDAVLARLSSAELPLALVWIDWPYPYGPARGHDNQFSQATQNSHAHRCPGGAAWIGHFDVDECPSGTLADDLHGLLARTPGRIGLLRVDSCWVPDVGGDRGTPPRASDFIWRDRTPRGKARKYPVRSRALRVANTHNARLRIGWFRRTLDPARARFLHYRALSTGWKKHAPRTGRDVVDRRGPGDDAHARERAAEIVRAGAPRSA